MEYTDYFVQMRDSTQNYVVATFGYRLTIEGARYLAYWLHERIKKNRTYIFDGGNDCLSYDKMWLDGWCHSNTEMADSLNLLIMKRTFIDDDDTSEKQEILEYYSMGRYELYEI